MLDKCKQTQPIGGISCTNCTLFTLLSCSRCPRRGGASARLFDVTGQLWAQFWGQSRSCLFTRQTWFPQGANSATRSWPTWIFEPLPDVERPSGILATPDTAAFSGERLPPSSARLALPSTLTAKRRHVTAKVARYGKKSFTKVSMSPDSGFDAVNYSVVDILIVHTEMFWLPWKPLHRTLYFLC